MHSTRKSYIVLLICWCIYMIAYLNRLNFAGAIEKISTELQLSESLIGLIPSIYFVVYALGQICNGFLGDLIKPHIFLSIAILGTGICNLFVGLSHSFLLIAIFWSLNGFFQSMYWGTLLKLLSSVFKNENNKMISTVMTTSMIVANILSWSLLGQLLVGKSYIYHFIIPALFSFLMMIVWFIYYHLALKKSIFSLIIIL